MGISLKTVFDPKPGTRDVSLAGVWLVLPMGPTVNHYYDPSARSVGKKILSGHAQRYRRTVYYELRRLTKSPIRRIPPPLRVEVELSFETKAKNDLDNRMKALLDSLCLAGMFKDDSEIDELIVRRGPVGAKSEHFFGGLCRVKVETITRPVVIVATEADSELARNLRANYPNTQFTFDTKNFGMVHIKGEPA